MAYIPQNRFLLTIVQYLREIVDERADKYLDEIQVELAAAIDKEVSITTLWRSLDRMNISNKRVSQLSTYPIFITY
jgi:hypothetical protein